MTAATTPRQPLKQTLENQRRKISNAPLDQSTRHLCPVIDNTAHPFESRRMYTTLHLLGNLELPIMAPNIVITSGQ